MPQGNSERENLADAGGICLMQSDVRYGALSEEWAEDWGCGDDPFNVLAEWKALKIGFDGCDVFGWAPEHCTDEVQVDWGSYAWKCRGSELIELAKRKSNYVENAEGIIPDDIYGVVFIEMD